MLEIGEIRKGKELGYKNKNRKYILAACVDCGKGRWQQLTKGKFRYGRCNKCAGKARRSSDNPQWKGGKTFSQGYTKIRIFPDDFFYPMATSRGSILEHRLVMAKYLGRCLHSWEIVHHKGIRYTGIENRSDNLIDNLELSVTIGEHSRNHSKGYRDGYERGFTDGRSVKIRQLEARIKELEA